MNAPARANKEAIMANHREPEKPSTEHLVEEGAAALALGGEPRHRAGVVDGEPGLYFVGLHFLYSLSSSVGTPGPGGHPRNARPRGGTGTTRFFGCRVRMGAPRDHRRRARSGRLPRADRQRVRRSGHPDRMLVFRASESPRRHPALTAHRAFSKGGHGSQSSRM